MQQALQQSNFNQSQASWSAKWLNVAGSNGAPQHMGVGQEMDGYGHGGGVEELTGAFGGEAALRGQGGHATCSSAPAAMRRPRSTPPHTPAARLFAPHPHPHSGLGVNQAGIGVRPPPLKPSCRPLPGAGFYINPGMQGIGGRADAGLMTAATFRQAGGRMVAGYGPGGGAAAGALMQQGMAPGGMHQMQSGLQAQGQLPAGMQVRWGRAESWVPAAGDRRHRLLRWQLRCSARSACFGGLKVKCGVVCGLRGTP